MLQKLSIGLESSIVTKEINIITFVSKLKHPPSSKNTQFIILKLVKYSALLASLSCYHEICIQLTLCFRFSEFYPL